MNGAPRPGTSIAEVLDRTRKHHIDDAALRKEVIIRLISSPLTLVPVMGGTTTLMALWALDAGSGMATFGAIAATLLGVGTFFTRLLLGTENAVNDAFEQLREKARKEREKALDELERNLVSDGDERTEINLRDLRVLASSFTEVYETKGAKSLGTSLDIQSKVDDLFYHCVVSLESTLHLWYSAQSLAKVEARNPILQRRETIIADVAESITQLGTILASMQGLRVGEAEENSKLARIRADLDESLNVARVVEKRMRDLDKEIDVESN